MVDTFVFNAPWGSSLKWITGLSVLLLGGIALTGFLRGPRDDLLWILGMIALPLGILILSACFMVRSYVVTPETLLVQRLGWNTKLDLVSLRSVVVDSQVMKGSIRTFGNGGLFSFSGYFRNKQLGTYRAFATDPSRAVVLWFTDHVVVITPEDPQMLAAKLMSYRRFPRERA